MRHLAFILILLAGGGPVASAEVLYDSEGFETPAHPAGPLRSSDAWHPGAGTPRPEIVELEDDTFGRVLRIYSPRSPQNSNNAVSFAPRHTGVLVLDFDVWTNTNFRSLYLLATTPDATASDMFYKATASLCWGATPGTVSHYAGRWINLGGFELEQWHHVTVLIHLSGPKAGTLDVNIDGGAFEGVDLPWRNRFELSPQRPISNVWFLGYGRPADQFGGSTDRYLQIDNVVISHVPAARMRVEDRRPDSRATQ